MKPVVKMLVALLVLGGGVYLYRVAGAPEKAAEKKDTPPVPVRVATADTRDLPFTLDLIGRGEARESVAIKSRVDGQVQTVLFSEGQAVKAGDTLLRLDPADFDARLRQAEANLARDLAQLQKARADVARYLTLQQQGFVSAEKLADLRAAEAAAEATAQADRAAVELARLQRSYTVVRAPISGLIGAQQVFPGTAVKTNDTVLALVNRIHPLRVAFSLPEQYLGQLRAAQATGQARVRVSVPGQPGPATEAPVRFLDHAVDPGTGTLLAKAELDNLDGRFAPGQYLRVELLLDTLKAAVTVPSEAIQQGPKGSVVYVVSPAGGIEIRPVAVAAERAGRAAIGQGVAAGETVVIDGHLRLTPKSKVQRVTQ